MAIQFIALVSIFATVSLLFVQLGPAPAIIQVHKTRATGATPLAPLVAMAANGWIWAMYGFLEGIIFPVAMSNIVGFVLGASYTAVFYNYTHERAYAHKVIGGFTLYVTIATIYAAAGVHGLISQSHAQIQQAVGYAGVLAMLTFFSSPFENIALVFEHRSNVFIPILLVAAGVVNTALWSLYSLLTSDWFIFFPTFAGLLIGTVQVALYLYFRPLETAYIDLGVRDTNAKDLETASSVLHPGMGDGHIAVGSPRILPLTAAPSSYGTAAQ